MQPTTGRRQLQRYLVGLLSYASDPWNVVDISSLTVVTASILRWICHADIALNTELAAVGTFLLWVRVIGYLNGLDMTAAYVRMTMAVISDMMPFMLILVLLIVGNAFVLLLLYPQSLELDDSDSGSGWHLGDEDEETIDDAFGDFSAALFTVRCCFLLQQTKLISASVARPLCLWHRFRLIGCMQLRDSGCATVHQHVLCGSGHRAAGQGTVTTAGDMALLLRGCDDSAHSAQPVDCAHGWIVSRLSISP